MNDGLEAENERLRKALTSTSASHRASESDKEHYHYIVEGGGNIVAGHLMAALSLLEAGGRKAAWSDNIFKLVMMDHKRSLNEARAALATKEKNE